MNAHKMNPQVTFQFYCQKTAQQSHVDIHGVHRLLCSMMGIN